MTKYHYEWVRLGILIDGTVRPRGKRVHLVLRKRKDKHQAFSVCSLKGWVAAPQELPRCKKCVAAHPEVERVREDEA